MHDIRVISRHKLWMQGNIVPSITLKKNRFSFLSFFFQWEISCNRRLVMSWTVYCGMDFRDEIVIGVQYNNEWICMLENCLSMIIILLKRCLVHRLFIVTAFAMECTWEGEEREYAHIDSEYREKYKTNSEKQLNTKHAFRKLENCILCAMHRHRPGHTHRHASAWIHKHIKPSFRLFTAYRYPMWRCTAHTESEVKSHAWHSIKD